MSSTSWSRSTVQGPTQRQPSGSGTSRKCDAESAPRASPYRAVKNSSNGLRGSRQPASGKKRSDSKTSTTGETRAAAKLAAAAAAEDSARDSEPPPLTRTSRASSAKGTSRATSVAGARTHPARRSTTTTDPAPPANVAATATPPSARDPAGVHGPSADSANARRSRRFPSPEPPIGAAASSSSSLSSATRAPSAASQRSSCASVNAAAFPSATAIQPAPAATPVRYTLSFPAPSLDSAPSVVHSGAGAGVDSTARSARTHATRSGSGGSCVGVTTHPNATYPSGAIGRHTANVPVFGFFRRRDPESRNADANPVAGFVAGRAAAFALFI